MTVILENEHIRVGINEHGAELSELVLKKTGANYLWSGDAKYWGRHAPVLFPTVGKLKNDEYFIDGKRYSMHQHGFARDMDFEVEEKQRTRAVFVLKSDSETKKTYPFEFVLKIAYTLFENTIETAYTVENPNDQEMPFGIGAHPAFSTQLQVGDEYDDYVVEITGQKSRRFLPLNAEGLFDLDKATEKDLFEINVSRETFSNDAIVFCNEGAPVEVVLKSKKHNHQVKMTSDDTLALGIWSCYPKDGQYVCLEPWWSIADTADTTQDFRKKYGIKTLAPNETFNASFKIAIK